MQQVIHKICKDIPFLESAVSQVYDMTEHSIFDDIHNIKVLNVTHSDLDGAVSAIVVRNVYDHCRTVPSNYGGSDFQAGLDAIAANDYDAVIFTDFAPSDPTVYAALQATGKPYLVIDHHQTAVVRKDDPRGTYVIDTSRCGALLSLDYFSRYKDLEYLRSLCVVTNDHDLWIRKIVPLSDDLNNLMFELTFPVFVEKYIHGLNNGDLFDDDKELMKNHAQQVADYVATCPHHDLPYNGFYIECDKYNSDINVMYGDMYDWLVMVGTTDDGLKKLSFRTRRKDVNIGKILKNMGRGGGGHPGAGGQIIPADEADDFINQFAERAFNPDKQEQI